MVVVSVVDVGVTEGLLATGDGDLVCFREMTKGDADADVFDWLPPESLPVGIFALGSSPMYIINMHS